MTLEEQERREHVVKRMVNKCLSSHNDDNLYSEENFYDVSIQNKSMSGSKYIRSQFSELSNFNARHLNAIYVSLSRKHR